MKIGVPKEIHAGERRVATTPDVVTQLKKLGFELIESLMYDDQQEKRTGHLYRLTAEQYHSHPIYQFHYE